MKKTLENLELAVKTARISAAKKAEMLGLIEELRREAPGCEAQRSEELRGTVAEFEVEHPDLVELTNRACKMLSDIGI